MSPLTALEQVASILDDPNGSLPQARAYLRVYNEARANGAEEPKHGDAIARTMSIRLERLSDRS